MVIPAHFVSLPRNRHRFYAVATAFVTALFDETRTAPQGRRELSWAPLHARPTNRNLFRSLPFMLVRPRAAENLLTAPKQEADERLLIEAAQKDPTRFAELYECNFERVYAYVCRRIGNRAEAQDVTSEVFQQALANLHKFEWRGVPFTAWLLRIAANAIADRWRRSSREILFSDAARPATTRARSAELEPFVGRDFSCGEDGTGVVGTTDEHR